MARFYTNLRDVTSGGGEGQILLEWTEWSEQSIQHWQYRLRPLYEPTWGKWNDVPDSEAETRRLRVRGLSLERAYEFQVRPWLLDGPGPVSDIVDGYVLAIGSDRIPIEAPGSLLERGRRFRFFGSEFTFVVPEAMTVRTGQGGSSTSDVVSILHDETTLGNLAVDLGTGEIARRTFWDAATDSYKLIVTQTGTVVRVWRGVPPPPGHDLDVLWDEIERSIQRDHSGENEDPRDCICRPRDDPARDSCVPSGGGRRRWRFRLSILCVHAWPTLGDYQPLP